MGHTEPEEVAKGRCGVHAAPTGRRAFWGIRDPRVFAALQPWAIFMLSLRESGGTRRRPKIRAFPPMRDEAAHGWGTRSQKRWPRVDVVFMPPLRGGGHFGGCATPGFSLRFN